MRPMSRFATGFEVAGAVRAEVFVTWLNGGVVELTGPDGPAPWIIDVEASVHPAEVVDRLVRDRIGEPLLMHSTSWRHDGGAVILSFIVVIDAGSVGPMASAPIPRARLARAEPTAAPDTVESEQVMEHALRHLAWLAMDDPVVAAELPGPWRHALVAYVPEPFRMLG